MRLLALLLLLASSALAQSSTGGDITVTSATSGTTGSVLGSKAWAPGPLIPLKPIATVDVTFPDTSGYTPLTATSTANLQTQINTAAAGCDNGGGSGATGYNITIAQGSVFTAANINLPVTTCVSSYIVIQTAGMSWTRGVRIDPSTSVGTMAKITGTTANQFSSLGVASNHFWFRGLDVETTGNISGQTFLLNNAATPATMPHHIILDHMYIHGRATNDLKQCVAFYVANDTAVVDSYISDCHDHSNDNQAISQIAGFRHLWQNNFLEAAGENTLTGGSGVAIADVPYGLQFGDLEDVNNWFYKPLEWMGGSKSPHIFEGSMPTSGIPHWDIKNIHEFKTCVRCWVHYFVMQNHWVENQPGAPLLVNQTGAGQPYNQEMDVTIEYGTVRGGSQSLQMQSGDLNFPNDPTPRANRIMFRHIVVDNNGDITQCSDPDVVCPVNQNYILAASGGGYGLIYDHITLPQSQAAVYNSGIVSLSSQGATERPMGMVYLSNSIFTHGYYGFRLNGGSSDKVVSSLPVDLNTWWGIGQLPVLRNDVIEGTYPTITGVTLNCAVFGTNTQCINSMTAVKFANWNGGSFGDYRLCSGVDTPVVGCTLSPYSAGGATPCSVNADGTGGPADCGADVATIQANIPASQTTPPSLWPDSDSGGGILLTPSSLTCNNSNTVTITPVAGTSGGNQLVQTGLDVLFHGAVITPSASSVSSITITPPTYTGVLTITNDSLTSDYAQYTTSVAHGIRPGDFVTVTGLSNGSFFNVTNMSVSTVTSTTFRVHATSGHANVAANTDSGTATAKLPITVNNFGLPLTALLTCN